MGRGQGNSSLKRKRSDGKSPAQNLSDAERIIYECIRSKKDLGIFQGDIKKETKLVDPLFKKSMKFLQDHNLIKEFAHYQNKGKKYFMAVEFEPSDEVTGGAWYSNGSLNMDAIDYYKRACSMCIKKFKVITVERIAEFFDKNPIPGYKFSLEKIREVVQTLVLDNDVMEVKSTETGEYAGIPFGALCYKPAKKQGGVPVVGAFTSIPCGVCPRIHECSPDGIISPVTCVYYTKWLEF
ncbi:hypothetical protein Sjap_019248 [Stephania japonica]|uniref:DNA-directed RNA polymerase III subunit RPC6 n=1 Tax=Stephania japonica TaxID=461633 RepID=A0AAP0F7B1_9MAGN